MLRCTAAGRERVKRNMYPRSTDMVVDWCRRRLNREETVVTKKGKNYYAVAAGCTITINAESYTIITAHPHR
ncbi:MAG: DUF3781 domain-containing protein [Lachnospiraceae bacterium]|nr:DUF3781 domain-containing protein [Ruminococcus sp.]MCM1165598.1 DUF3781 domain-containing protein [Ruminococcus sp.]MCM1275063.1 DUF3781 domain-containing protein [Lachnospiraceae bacterium]MCM1275064.1 DUF3781 domain-containing protein [Lachnospiraceae bacterium]